MSNQLNNEPFILNPASPLAALNPGLSLMPQQIVQVNGQLLAAGNEGNASGSIWAPAVASTGGPLEMNYNLVLNEEAQPTVHYSVNSLPQLGQVPEMAQAAQIVLLPTQNLNLMAGGMAKQEQQVQVLLPNDGGYQLLTSIPNVGVLVPTNLLLSNGLILMPNSPESVQAQITLESTIETQVNGAIANSIHNGWLDSGQQQQQQEAQQQQALGTLVNYEATASQPMVIAEPQEFITISDPGPAGELVNQTAHLISNNGQIVGIIGSDQLSLLQAGDGSAGGETGQVLLATCIDPNEAVIGGVGGLTLAAASSPLPPPTGVLSSSSGYDINTVLASTISTLAVEKSDSNQAKQWLKDSYIVNRALKALKKNHSTGPHHANHRVSSSGLSTRPHPQVHR